MAKFTADSAIDIGHLPLPGIPIEYVIDEESEFPNLDYTPTEIHVTENSYDMDDEGNDVVSTYDRLFEGSFTFQEFDGPDETDSEDDGYSSIDVPDQVIGTINSIAVSDQIFEPGKFTISAISIDCKKYFSLTVDALTKLFFAGSDEIQGSGFADKLASFAGDDVVDGRSGNDELNGGAGSDTLMGGNGDDILIGGAGADKLIGGKGSDTASYLDAAKGVTASLLRPGENTGDAKGDTYSSVGNLSGSSHNDSLIGNDAVNSIRGEAGDDRLIGGAGRDELRGGSGNDRFIFIALSDSTTDVKNRDTIYDFAKGDRVDLTSIDASTKKGGNQAFTFIGTDKFHGKAGELRFDKAKSDTYVYADTNGDKKADFAIHLDDAVTLQKADFLL